MTNIDIRDTHCTFFYYCFFLQHIYSKLSLLAESQWCSSENRASGMPVEIWTVWTLAFIDKLSLLALCTRKYNYSLSDVKGNISDRFVFTNADLQ